MDKNNNISAEVSEIPVVVSPEGEVMNPAENIEAPAENNVEKIDVVLSDNLKAAIRVLARDYKKGDANHMAANLLAQVVKGRLKAKRESAAKDSGENYDRMIRSLTPELVKLMPSRQDYVSKELSTLDDAIKYV